MPKPKPMPKHQQRYVQQAIAKAGSIRALARELDISHVALMQWRQIPPEHVMKIEKLIEVPRRVLRPDIYPPDRERK
jgi:DNA-binding transcriptional regulator YdaS (Cro superfamily)